MLRVAIAVACIAGCGRSHFDEIDAGNTGDAGVDGAPNTSCPAWCAETSPTTMNLRSVWARSPDDVWAVGENGVVLRRRGGVWTALAQTTNEALGGVWLAPDADEAFIVGNNEVRIRYQGETPSMVTNASGYLAGVWGVDSGNVYAVGDGATVLHWNGGTWAAVGGVTGSLSAIHGSVAPVEIWIASTGNDVYRSSGEAFAPIDVPAPDTDWFDIWVGGPTDAWFIGYENMHWNGSAWTEYFAPEFTFVFETVYSDGSNIWAAGTEGLGWFDGAQFIKLLTPTTQVLRSLHGVGDEAWAVGDGGAIIRFKP